VSQPPDNHYPGQRQKRQAVNRLWAWAALAGVPVFVVLAIGLIASDRRPPAIVTVAAGSSQLDVGTSFRRTTIKDFALYVAPDSAVDTTKCVIPWSAGNTEVIHRTKPDRPATATRTVDGVRYHYYGHVFSLTRRISCTPGATGLLLTEWDGDHTKRNFAFVILATCPVLALIALRILRARGTQPPRRSPMTS
jgi:hypothetical protein